MSLLLLTVTGHRLGRKKLSFHSVSFWRKVHSWLCLYCLFFNLLVNTEL